MSFSLSAQNTFPASGNVGIGTTAPQQRLHVEGSNNQAIFVNTSALGPTSGSGQISYVKALPTASGQRLGYFQVGSRGGAQYNYNAAGMVGYAGEAWSSTSRPTYLTFETTPIGSTTRAERLRIKSNGYIGIGTTSPTQKLHVVGKGMFTSGLTVTNGTISVQSDTGNGVYAKSTGYGVYGLSQNEEDDLAGVYGKGYYGVHGNSGWIGVYATGGTYGLVAGGLFTGVSGSTAGGYGVEGYSDNSIGVYGYTGSSSSFAGYFDGDVYVSGTFGPSDAKLKKGIGQISGALSIIGKLQPKSYEYRQDGNYALMNLPKGKRYGLIAQDVEEALPTLVKAAIFNTARTPHPTKAKRDKSTTDQPAEEITFKTVNYTELIPLLIAAVQEQQTQIKDQKETIARQQDENKELLRRLERVEAAINSLPVGAGSGIEESKAKLGAATPNPAGHLTTISYSLPEGSRKAYIIVTDMKGSTIRQINLSGKGSRQVQLNTAALAAGTYTYSLFVDGSKVNTKQLLVAR
ncbi:hypothetical protein BUE76_21850 [Cnuella takakiae]|nr:hypothetical protein BUE76_21850 [Cnuella takakiae]